MNNFYHIFIVPRKDIMLDQVTKKMDLAVDWFRCTPNVWIVYTTSDENTWQTRLKSLVDPDGSLFICRLDINKRNGWMTKRFWDWIRKKN